MPFSYSFSRTVIFTLLILFATSALHAESFFSEKNIDTLHSNMVNSVTDTARWLDSFFDDSVYEEEQNQSRVKVRFDLFTEKGESVDFKARVNARLRLPNTEKKWNLFISGNDDGDFNNADNNRPESTQNDDSSVGANYFFTNKLHESISVGGGFSRRDGSYGLYLKPRYRKSWEMGNWGIRFTQTARYHTHSKFDTETRVDFERLLSDTLFFRSTSQLNWYDVEPGIFYNFNFLVRQSIDKNRVMSYEWNNYFETKPQHELDVSVLRVVYRQRFWKKWLFYEIAPQVTFPQDNNHNITPGLLLRLEAVFGYGDIAI